MNEFELPSELYTQKVLPRGNPKEHCKPLMLQHKRVFYTLHTAISYSQTLLNKPLPLLTAVKAIVC